jgi:protein ImuB
LVVAAKRDNAMRLHAVDKHAARDGLSEGMKLADARARVPQLRVVEADEKADARLLERIADWCDRYTPFVACDGEDGLLLDVTGTTHLFGGERAMAALLQKNLQEQGFVARLALAGTAAAAHLLARHAPSLIVAPGKEAEAVSQLPVTALAAEADVIHGLRRAGLKTVGDVAARGRAELSARFGRELVMLLDHTLGRTEKPLSPRRRLPDCMAEHRFAEPLITADAIAATLEALATSLARVLEERGQGAKFFCASFFRSDGQVRRIAVETGQALRDPAVVARLFGEKLDALADPLDPGFGFDLIRLEASRTAADTQAISAGERELSILIDRLAARFGRERVLRFHQEDTHIPEAAAPLVPAQRETARPFQKMPEDGRRPLRMFAKPEPIDVPAQMLPDGPPAQFTWRRKRHHTLHAQGPERIAMEWWKSQSSMPTRDYFRVEDEEGRKFWLFREGLLGRETTIPRWYLHGLFA